MKTTTIKTETQNSKGMNTMITQHNYLENTYGIDELARKASAGTLRILHSQSSENMIRELRWNLQRDFRIMDKKDISNTYSDAIDLYNIAYAHLDKYIVVCGLSENDLLYVSTRKGGKWMTVYQAACYHVRRHIYMNRSIYDSSPKEVYIEDLRKSDDDNDPLDREYIKMQRYNGIRTEYDYHYYGEIIEMLNLTARERDIINMRMQGMSVSDIGKRWGVSSSAISNRLIKIQEDIKRLFPSMVRHFKAGRVKK